ncbi:aminopeptidase P N-terminal domain-containing protein [Tautonia plasticadhaerens]|uniref:Xaa-Pro aminopeptidase n=1 Tax=Tautonia plasticadhaerens TaxID=2527974 RepID=A0A518H2S7_9BACT|nr:aminopeptidase P N-terminal domain-containing protein [Tautonia plasticadhaerens]QDV35123.1 Xaa-Pro aminopeptidase [Tautonia plasticadhaerens]
MSRLPRPNRPIALAGLILLAIAPPSTARQEPTASGLPVAEYASRREALQDLLGGGVVVVRGAEPMAEDYFRFRQRNDFMYLTGIEQPDALLLLVPEGLDPEGQARSVVFLPPRNPFAERWSGPQVVPGEETARAFGLDEALPTADFEARLAEALGRDAAEEGGESDADAGTGDADADAEAEADGPATIYTHLPPRRDGEGSPEARFRDQLEQLSPDARFEEVSPSIASLRLIKSDAEVVLLRRAIDITIEAHRDAARVIEPGTHEYEAQGALEYAFTRNGAQREAFASIVGSGPNSVVLHYNANRRRMEDGDLVVIDIGAEFDYYAADLTRTYPVSGRFTDRQREVYQLVLDAQRAAESAFEPGKTTINDLHQAAIARMKESPLRDSQGRTLERYFVHGLGHWLGMDVHDVGDYRRPIPEGAVFTIEPGIYIPEESLGVRIEDDYLAAADGLVKLSEALPSEPDEVEAMMAVEVSAE